MSGFWKCPVCEFKNDKTEWQLRSSGSVLVGFSESHRRVPCQRCYRTVDVQDILDGKLDPGKLQQSPEEERRDKILGCSSLILGAVAAVTAYQFFGVILSLGIGIVAVFVLGALAFKIFPLKEPKAQDSTPSTSAAQQLQEAAHSPWESMPRVGDALSERIMEQYSRSMRMFEALDLPSGAQREVSITMRESDIVEKACVWNVPTFYVINDEACCFLKIKSHYQDENDSIADSISRDKVRLRATFSPFPTFPVVSLLLLVPAGDSVRLIEAAPNLVMADARDSLDALLKTRKGAFHYFFGELPQLLAKGQFSVESIDDLRHCLDQAATHFSQISPREVDYGKAVDEYFRTTILTAIPVSSHRRNES